MTREWMHSTLQMFVVSVLRAETMRHLLHLDVQLSNYNRFHSAVLRTYPSGKMEVGFGWHNCQAIRNARQVGSRASLVAC